MDITSRFPKDAQVAVVYCTQWGDTGKGKVVDVIAACWADIIARGTGGPNAGHTVVFGGKWFIFHSLPSSITLDGQGKVSVIGNGTVNDLQGLVKELDGLAAAGLSHNNLFISEEANLILPIHKLLDKGNVSLVKGSIGSTGRGIGPCYADKIARRGVQFRDLFDDGVLAGRLRKLARYYGPYLPLFDMTAKSFVDEYLALARRYRDRVKDMVTDTRKIIHDGLRNGKRLLVEGAQGTLLSIEHGTRLFQTASDCSLNGLCSGVGISAYMVDVPIGIVKFPVMTRVGGGPFPTEFGSEKSERYCAEDDGKKNVVKAELLFYGVPFKEVDGEIRYDRNHQAIIKLKNSTDEFTRGVGMRLGGFEYGATTKRPRRTGWTDLVALRYALEVNGSPNVVLTKVDMAEGLEHLRLCTAYENLPDGFTTDSDKLYCAKPLYQQFAGPFEDLGAAKTYEQLPLQLRKAIEFTEQYAGAKVLAVSNGPDREQTIVK